MRPGEKERMEVSVLLARSNEGVVARGGGREMDEWVS